MAEENSQDNLERSEEATPKRRDEARKQGQFARSKELIPAATLTMLLIAMRFAGGELLERQGRLLAGFIVAAGGGGRSFCGEGCGVASTSGGAGWAGRWRAFSAA